MTPSATVPATQVAPSPRIADENTRSSPTVLATWRCAGDSVYSLTVLPDGTFKDDGDKIKSFGFTVQLVNFDQYRMNYDQFAKSQHWAMAVDSPPSDFYWQNTLLSFDDVNNAPFLGLEKVLSPYEQSVETSKKNGKFTEIKASVGAQDPLFSGVIFPYLFSLSEDVEGWKFLFSTQYLTTKKKATELTIYMAGKPHAEVFSAEATSILSTGDCYKQD